MANVGSQSKSNRFRFEICRPPHLDCFRAKKSLKTRKRAVSPYKIFWDLTSMRRAETGPAKPTKIWWLQGQKLQKRLTRLLTCTSSVLPRTNLSTGTNLIRSYSSVFNTLWNTKHPLISLSTATKTCLLILKDGLSDESFLLYALSFTLTLLQSYSLMVLLSTRFSGMELTFFIQNCSGRTSFSCSTHVTVRTCLTSKKCLTKLPSTSC